MAGSLTQMGHWSFFDLYVEFRTRCGDRIPESRTKYGKSTLAGGDLWACGGDLASDAYAPGASIR